MKKLLVLFLLVAAISAQAQDVDSFIELLRSDVETQKKVIITEAMDFTEAEANAFWPVYREYMFELEKLGDKRVILVKAYAENYLKMTDEKAKELMEKSFDFQDNRLDILSDYFDKVSDAITPTKAAKWVQLEHRINLLIDLQIAAELPLVEKPAAKEETKSEE